MNFENTLGDWYKDSLSYQTRVLLAEGYRGIVNSMFGWFNGWDTLPESPFSLENSAELNDQKNKELIKQFAEFIALPSSSVYINQYDYEWLRNYYFTIISVGFKLSGDQNHSEDLVCSTAEELAVHSIYQHADYIIAAWGLTEDNSLDHLSLRDNLTTDINNLYEEAFQDTDFLFLFDDISIQADVQADIHLRDMRMRLAYDTYDIKSWFEPFYNSSLPLNHINYNYYKSKPIPENIDAITSSEMWYKSFTSLLKEEPKINEEN